ncbi:DUF6185 family protein [Streptomyces sp. NPDC059894]|uniref:DUF6185 family protein n=1 Tax=unclassified Streptomyces TaxID=2593676 RepID=UPI00366726B5
MSVLAALLCLLAAPAAAWADEPFGPERCAPERLSDARVRTSVVLEHDQRSYSKITTRLTVDVPAAWPLAPDLLLGERSRRHIRAMSCLTRTDQGEQRRWTEWRVTNPVVTWRGDHVRVVYRAHSWANEYRSFIDVGLWRFRAGAERWTLRLRVPPALKGARWEKISVDPGRPGAEWARPRPTAGEGATALVWRPDGTDGRRGGARTDAANDRTVPAVRVGLDPSWQRSWSAQSNRLSALGLDSLGRLFRVCLVSALLLAAARLYRLRPQAASPRQLRTLDHLTRWARYAVPLFLVVDAELLVERGIAHADAWPAFPAQLFIEYGLALPVILTLLVVAGLPLRWSFAVVTVLNPMAASVLVGASRELVGVGFALGVQTALAFCCVAATLLALTAVLWRIAVDGHLLPKSRRFPGRDRILRPAPAVTAVVATTAVVAVCYALAEERDWLRASWLSDPASPGFGTERLEDYLWTVMWSVSFLQDLLVADHAWLLTAVAVLAVLRAWRRPGALTPLDDPADRILFLTFFAVTVGLGSGKHLENALPTALWIPLYMAALYGTAALLAPRSVLAQRFELSGRPLATAATPAARAPLLRRARSYREIHAELRRLDQGLFGDEPPKRDDLEKRLEKLHDWPARAPSAVSDRLPGKVSVVDAALALGPRDDWWANGRRGALYALLPGLPAAVLGAWAWHVRGEAWQDTLSDLVGLPSLLLNALYWAVAWSAAGFTLGALWRVLPGRRGAVKALPVTAAFGLPLGLDALVGWFARESTTNSALHLSMMLFVLTVTAIALDFDTFGGERRYWQSRMGLLLSVYQMRYYSLQVAYLVAQVIAMISIWQFFAEPDVAPSQDATPPAPGG